MWDTDIDAWAVPEVVQEVDSRQVWAILDCAEHKGWPDTSFCDSLYHDFFYQNFGSMFQIVWNSMPRMQALLVMLRNHKKIIFLDNGKKKVNDQ